MAIKVREDVFIAFYWMSRLDLSEPAWTVAFHPRSSNNDQHNYRMNVNHLSWYLFFPPVTHTDAHKHARTHAQG